VAESGRKVVYEAQAVAPARANLTQPMEPLPTPDRAAVYARLVDEHHVGVRKFKSVAAFHLAYLEQGGTPRKKSVGKDRLLAGVPIGRKLNRVSKKQSQAKTAAAAAGRSRVPTGYCGTSRLTLVPSNSKNNRHGMGGQASLAADQLNLSRSYSATRSLTLRVHPPGNSKGGRNYVKVENPYPNGRGASSGKPHERAPLPPHFSVPPPGCIYTKEGHLRAAPRAE
jgi:hypothetical protein